MRRRLNAAGLLLALIMALALAGCAQPPESIVGRYVVERGDSSLIALEFKAQGVLLVEFSATSYFGGYDYDDKEQTLEYAYDDGEGEKRALASVERTAKGLNLKLEDGQTLILTRVLSPS